MIKFQSPEIQKLSAITGSSPIQIQNLVAMGLINESRALDFLINYDFTRIKRRQQYKVKEIVQALADRYNVPTTRVHHVAYAKVVKRFHCTKCGKAISARNHKLGKGLCPKCASDRIKQQINPIAPCPPQMLD